MDGMKLDNKQSNLTPDQKQKLAEANAIDYNEVMKSCSYDKGKVIYPIFFKDSVKIGLPVKVAGPRTSKAALGSEVPIPKRPALRVMDKSPCPKSCFW